MTLANLLAQPHCNAHTLWLPSSPTRLLFLLAGLLVHSADPAGANLHLHSRQHTQDGAGRLARV
jgi:hypothetical protein